MEPKFKVYTVERNAQDDRAHFLKLALAEGKVYPQTPDMLVRGSRCSRHVIPDEKLLAQFPTDYYPHPDPSVKKWMTVVTPWMAAQQGKVDPTTSHAIDMSMATADLPDWDASISPGPGDILPS